MLTAQRDTETSTPQQIIQQPKHISHLKTYCKTDGYAGVRNVNPLPQSPELNSTSLLNAQAM